MKGKQLLILIFLTAMLCVGGFLAYQELDARKTPPILEETNKKPMSATQSDFDIGADAPQIPILIQDYVEPVSEDGISVSWPQIQIEEQDGEILELSYDTPVADFGGEQKPAASAADDGDHEEMYIDDTLQDMNAWDDFDDLTVTSRSGSSDFWMMEVETAKRTKSFRVRSGVDTNTLKKHVGWMESSARPGEDGITIIMGHRDEELRILKDVGLGDPITITEQDGKKYIYYVRHAEIIGKDEAMNMPMTDEKTLILFTCYPFHYSGSAPQQFILYAYMREG